MKSSQEQFDDRVVEVAWNPRKETWRFMRFRDDKPHGNHQSTVESVLKSIIDGVEVPEVRVFPSVLDVPISTRGSS